MSASLAAFALTTGPQGVLELQDVATVTDEDSCIACGVCVESCPAGAITEIAED